MGPLPSPKTTEPDSPVPLKEAINMATSTTDVETLGIVKLLGGFVSKELFEEMMGDHINMIKRQESIGKGG